jgi:hypothetical protein
MTCPVSGNYKSIGAALAASLLWAATAGRAQNAPTAAAMPQVRVEYFGTERGYTIGRSDIVLLCILRNIGTNPLPEKALRLHCYAIAGLDYTQGDMDPGVPPLAPNQAAAFRWRLTPSESRQALIAAAQVESDTPPAAIAGRPMADPPVTLTVVPRFDAPPRFGAPIVGADLTPQAGTARGEAWLASNRIALRFLASDRDEPILLLAAKPAAAWQMVTTGMPLARVRSCEDGQLPWCETFRWRRTRAYVDKDRAMLTLIGNIGTRWSAELTFEAHHDTCVIEGRLRLTARRTLRCYSVSLPCLLAAEENPNGGVTTPRADGSPMLLPESDPSPLPDDARVLAARQSGITFGLTWPSNPPLAGWVWGRLPGPAVTGPTLAATCSSSDRTANGEVVLPGATLELPFRLFAFGPSDTIRDALRFMLP